MRPASQRFFIHSSIYLRILIISYLATFLVTDSLYVLICRKAVNHSINILLYWAICNGLHGGLTVATKIARFLKLRHVVLG